MALKGLRRQGQAVYRKALRRVVAMSSREAAEEYVAMLRPHDAKALTPEPWAGALQYRRPAAGRSKGMKRTYRQMAQLDHQKAEKKFPAVYGPDSMPDEAWMEPRAFAFRQWCLFRSWRMCSQCGRMVKQKLRGKSLRLRDRTPNEMTACDYCRSGGKVGYRAPLPDEQPPPLRKLPPPVLKALRPFEVHTGWHYRAPHGYRMHTDMFRVSLKTQPVAEALRKLPKKQRRKGEKALAYLLQAKESSYCDFALLHSKFLEKRERAIERGDTWAGAPVKRMPAGFLETVGLECALWPHLYWRTDMCESYIRSQDSRRKKKVCRRRWDRQWRMRGEDQDGQDEHYGGEEQGGILEEAGESAQAERQRQSLKASFLAKAHSSLVGYGADPELLHYVWDLWLWSAVGGAKNGSGVRIREALAHKPFSPELWRTYHMGLVDLQKQLGWPSLFLTIAPFEWSFPYHAWLQDELQKNLAQKLHAPVAETLHLAHVLTQAVTGLLTGSNDGFKARGDHVFSGPQSGGQVKHWVARLEFQDGKRKRGAGKDPLFYHGSGRPHVHILLWLDDLLAVDIGETVKAVVPGEDEAELRDLVLGSQLDWHDSGWPCREGPTSVVAAPEGGQLLCLRHPQEAKSRKCRAYVQEILEALRCHTDVLASDGRAMVLKYCASALAAFHGRCKVGLIAATFNAACSVYGKGFESVRSLFWDVVGG